MRYKKKRNNYFIFKIICCLIAAADILLLSGIIIRTTTENPDLFNNAATLDTSGQHLSSEASPSPEATPVITAILTPALSPTPSEAPQATLTPVVSPTPSAIPEISSAPVLTISPTPAVYSFFGPVEDAPTFSGRSYIIADVETGEIILAYNPEEVIYPASTIKLLTAITALEHADPSFMITSEKSVLQNIDSDVHVMDVPAGTTYSLEVWLNLLLVCSYGDVADTIAYGIAGSVEEFVGMMNDKLAMMGLKDTLVDNTIGLDIGNDFDHIHTTANDMLLITLEAMKYPLIREIASQPRYLVPASGRVEEHFVLNSNLLISSSEKYSSSMFKVTGLKTGTTDAAGSCLSASVRTHDGHDYVCVYFGGKDHPTLAAEIIDMFEYAITLYSESQNR